jgi:hypothetical protein
VTFLETTRASYDTIAPACGTGTGTAYLRGLGLDVFGVDRHEHVLRTEAFGHTIELNYYFRSPEAMTEALSRNGFDVHTTTRRKVQEGERIPRAMLLARRSSS